MADRRGRGRLRAARGPVEGDGHGPRDGAGRARHGGGARMSPALLVIAKEPVPGRVKTRLCPPCTPEQAARLAHAFADCGEPAVLVGMDTPQVAPALLTDGLAALAGADAVFGPATDGGYWAIGLRQPNPAVFAGVPMSRVYTGAIQRARLAALGLRTADLPPLRDVDDIAAARAVAADAPGSRFAAALAEIDARVAVA